MNKRHWNTIHIEGIPTPLLRDLILHSYHLVTASLPRRTGDALGLL
jgi:predicted DNA-binding protein (MmcQ/YjbR family)